MAASTESANSAEMMIFMTLSPCGMQSDDIACGARDYGRVRETRLCCKSQEEK